MEVNDAVPDVFNLQPIRLELGGVPYQLYPKKFSTGSIGWYLSTKGEVQGRRCQFSLSVTVIGSKGKANAEQTATAPKTDPEASLFDRTFGNGSEPSKPRRKRS